VDLVRDILDKPVVDANGHPMGRVDGIVLEHLDGEPPRAAAIEIGPIVLGERLHPTIGRWIAAIEHAFGLPGDRRLRIPFAEVSRITNERRLKIPLTFDKTQAAVVEKRLQRWISKLPGA
jgi:sporulation protein YlmC with PRC-barrel domain